MNRLHLIACLAVLGCASCAQDEVAAEQFSSALDSVTWYSPDASPEGTAPTIVFDRAASGPSDSYFDVTIHGFWRSNALHALRIPSAPHGDPGTSAAWKADELRLLLALPGPTGGNSVTRTSLATTSYSMAAIGVAFANPQSAVGAVVGNGRVLDSIRGIEVAFYPFEIDPSSDLVKLHHSMRLHVTHPASGATQPSLPKERGRAAAALFANWSAVSSAFPVNTTSLEAELLILVDSMQATVPALATLITRKLRLGYHTTSQVLKTNDCAGAQSAVQTWYASLPESADKHVLILTSLGQCSSPSGALSDQPIANIAGPAHPEVHVGRIALSSDPNDPLIAQSELVSVLAKEAAYEEDTSATAYGTALMPYHYRYTLCADEAGRNSSCYVYGRTVDEVVAQTYARPPTWSVMPGYLVASSNAHLVSAWNAGLGLVSYTGHGDTLSWEDSSGAWNALGEAFPYSSIPTSNVHTPAVWAFGCDNALSLFTHSLLVQRYGAISHYAATIATGTDYNRILEAATFAALYDVGVTTQGDLIDLAEARFRMGTLQGQRDAHVDAYGLYGDPTVRMRRTAPRGLGFAALPVVSRSACQQAGGCDLPVTLSTSDGSSAAGTRISLYKAANGLMSGEVFVNQYIRAGNQVVVHLPPTVLGNGSVSFTAQDDEGNTTLTTVPTSP